MAGLAYAEEEINPVTVYHETHFPSILVGPRRAQARQVRGFFDLTADNDRDVRVSDDGPRGGKQKNICRSETRPIMASPS